MELPSVQYTYVSTNVRLHQLCQGDWEIDCY